MIHKFRNRVFLKKRFKVSLKKILQIFFRNTSTDYFRNFSWYIFKNISKDFLRNFFFRDLSNFFLKMTSEVFHGFFQNIFQWFIQKFTSRSALDILPMVSSEIYLEIPLEIFRRMFYGNLLKFNKKFVFDNLASVPRISSDILSKIASDTNFVGSVSRNSFWKSFWNLFRKSFREFWEILLKNDS